MDIAVALPLELLERIFIFSTDFPVKFPPSRDQFPIVLCHVCSYWRQVALKTKLLWNYVGNYPCKSSNRDLHLSILRTWFERSAPFPIEFVDGGVVEYPPRVQVRIPNGWTWPFKVIQDVVVPYHSRLRVLRLLLTRQDLNSFFFLPPNYFDSLEELQLQLCEGTGAYHRVKSKVLQTLPRIRSFMFYDGRTSPDDLHLPWRQLRTLHITHALPVALVHSVLCQATSVEDCIFSVQDPFLEPPPPITTFPSIKRLTLRIIGNSTFSQACILPSLHDLTIAYNATVDFHESFLPGIQHLTKLCLVSLSSDNVEPIPLSDIVQATPHLTTLILHTPPIVNKTFLSNLCAGRIVPHLSHFEFKTSKLRSICEGLTSAVKKYGHSSLESVIIQYEGPRGLSYIDPNDERSMRRSLGALQLDVSVWKEGLRLGNAILLYGKGREKLGLDVLALKAIWQI
ncbi:hypothetical protein BDN72DRAFT_844722 [Pluteus cervinus]|uniref:Uncharacterized protein n=1 Tax=Pluteus cervinus TaxID=181527 RepID=A0ACD3ALN8_9AGAR|nr:hypothetical protein BDN72DRAFT_844722 [Pluteus cervinus]